MSASERVSALVERLRTGLSGLSPRDRVLLVFMLMVFLSVVGYFTVEAMNKATRQVTRNLEATERAQNQVDGLMGQFQDRSATGDALRARLEAGRNFTPLTWLETVGNEMEISGNIRSMTERGVEETDFYKAQKIDIVVDDINLRQTVDLMYRLESAAQAIRLNEVRVKTDRKNRELLDLRMQISVLKPLEAT